MRILITGSRQWTDVPRLRGILIQEMAKAIQTDDPWITFVHGACPSGADRIASGFINRINMNGRSYPLEERHPADWDRYGKAAGFRRNAEMVSLGADLCIAFIVPGKSRGTENTVKLARAAGIPVTEVIASASD
jgi:hypothetical protein